MSVFLNGLGDFVRLSKRLKRLQSFLVTRTPEIIKKKCVEKLQQLLMFFC